MSPGRVFLLVSGHRRGGSHWPTIPRRGSQVKDLRSGWFVWGGTSLPGVAGGPGFAPLPFLSLLVDPRDLLVPESRVSFAFEGLPKACLSQGFQSREVVCFEGRALQVWPPLMLSWVQRTPREGVPYGSYHPCPLVVLLAPHWNGGTGMGREGVLHPAIARGRGEVFKVCSIYNWLRRVGQHLTHRWRLSLLLSGQPAFPLSAPPHPLGQVICCSERAFSPLFPVLRLLIWLKTTIDVLRAADIRVANIPKLERLLISSLRVSHLRLSLRFLFESR
jgi:hypothetical protein